MRTARETIDIIVRVWHPIQTINRAIRLINLASD